MKVISPYSIVDSKMKEKVDLSGSISLLFGFWKTQTESKNPSLKDAFMAGYCLGSNSMLREKYNKAIKSEDIYDNRIN